MIRSLKFRSRSTVHHRGRALCQSILFVHQKAYINGISRGTPQCRSVIFSLQVFGGRLQQLEVSWFVSICWNCDKKNKTLYILFLGGFFNSIWWLYDDYDDYMMIMMLLDLQTWQPRWCLQALLAAIRCYECFVVPLQMEALRSRTRFICTYFTVESTRAPVTFGYIWIKDRPTSRFGCFLASGS